MLAIFTHIVGVETPKAWDMYAPEMLQKAFSSLQARGKQAAEWGDAQASRALSLASTALWAPLSIPLAAFRFSVGLYPVQTLLLKPLQYLQTSTSVCCHLSLVRSEWMSLLTHHHSSCTGGPPHQADPDGG